MLSDHLLFHKYSPEMWTDLSASIHLPRDTGNHNKNESSVPESEALSLLRIHHLWCNGSDHTNSSKAMRFPSATYRHLAVILPGHCPHNSQYYDEPHFRCIHKFPSPCFFHFLPFSLTVLQMGQNMRTTRMNLPSSNSFPD